MTRLFAAPGGESFGVAFPERPGDIYLEKPVNVLASFHFYRNIDMAELASWGLRIIADSGAFSAANSGAFIDLREYVDWINRWSIHLHWVASLDVIGNPKKSWQNWRSLAADGTWTVPTIHYPCSPSELDRYADSGVDFVGLGGMVPYKSEPRRLLRWCLAVMRHARDNYPHVRFHGWGITHPDLLLNLPWWSVDSSGYSSAYRYGMLRLFDPEQGRMMGVEVRVGGGRAIAEHRRLLARHYRLEDWRRIAVSNGSSRRDLLRISLRSWQLAERFMTNRWHVPPPASLRDGPTGPTVHAALGAPAMQPTRSLSPTDQSPKEMK